MRAAWYERTGPADDVIMVGEQPAPAAGPGEVRIRLEASGVNPADGNRRRGQGYSIDNWTQGVDLDTGKSAGNVLAIKQTIDGDTGTNHEYCQASARSKMSGINPVGHALCHPAHAPSAGPHR